MRQWNACLFVVIESLFDGFFRAPFPLRRGSRAVCVFGNSDCGQHEVSLPCRVHERRNDEIACGMHCQSKDDFDGLSKLSIQFGERTEVFSDGLVSFGEIGFVAHGGQCTRAAREGRRASFLDPAAIPTRTARTPRAMAALLPLRYPNPPPPNAK